MKKEEKKFSLKDLKPMMVCELRGGDKTLVLEVEDKLFMSGSNTYTLLDSENTKYSEDFTAKAVNLDYFKGVYDAKSYFNKSKENFELLVRKTERSMDIIRVYKIVKPCSLGYILKNSNAIEDAIELIWESEDTESIKPLTEEFQEALEGAIDVLKSML